MNSKRVVIIVIVLIVIIFIFHPGRHAKYYNHIQFDDVLDEFVTTKQKHNLKNCTINFYKDLIKYSTEINPEDIINPEQTTGGEHFPTVCKAIFKTALLIPYRNRKSQLDRFLKYMHYFLQAQRIHYKIFVIEQNDTLPFNRAKMLNYGAKEAIKQNFPCLILHDVDLFPLCLSNIYACAKMPRHMSSSIDTFRYNLPYLSLSGGAFAIQTKHFERINGMSNEYDGWGGEDDDFYTRLKMYNLIPYRFPPELSKYTMLFHKKERASSARFEKLSISLEKQELSGLNSLTKEYRVIVEPSFTHVIV